MATLDTFAVRRGWKITHWAPHNSGLPDDAFDLNRTTLLVGITNPVRQTCNVAWLNRNHQWCFIAELSYNDGELTGADTAVRCGDVTFHRCSVDLSVIVTEEKWTLKGNITHYPFVDGNTGTFTAEADPMGEECKA